MARRLREAAVKLRTPSLVAFAGRGQPDLTEVAAAVLAAVGAAGAAPAHWPAQPPSPSPSVPPPPGPVTPGFIRGLFSGGTLCDEAIAIAADRLGPIASNIPLEPGWALAGDLRAPGHLMIDF